MRSIPANRLLLMGMSMRRNLPPTGTAGLARSRVRGHSRLPCPPPRIAVTTFSMAASPAGGWILQRRTVLAQRYGMPQTGKALCGWRYNPPMPAPRRPLHWEYLGRVPYSEALALQLAARAALKSGEGPERL